MEVQLSDDGAITIENERYSPWPRFRVDGVEPLGVRLNCKHLKYLLHAEDLFCNQWQLRIPSEILHQLRCYPEGHAELIELAQLDSGRFLRLSRRNPALTYIASAYWTAYSWRRIPPTAERDTRRVELLGFKRRRLIETLGLPLCNEWARILSKIPAGHCRDYHIRNVVELCADKQIRRYLRHVSAITLEVSWLLRMERPLLDMPLLELAASQSEDRGLRLTDIVSSIINKREMAERKPFWPYGGTIRSWEQLLRAERRNATKCGDVSVLFPSPPVLLENLPDGLKIIPLTTPQMVSDEASEMENCVVDYLKTIQLGEHYLYRMEAPVRASVLLKRGRFCWEVEEIGLRYNEGEVDDEIEWLITRWMRSNYQHHKHGN